MGPEPPTSASWSSRRFQFEGLKKSVVAPVNAAPGPKRRIASPPIQDVAPAVLPVATNNEEPSLARPPGAQIPPFAAAVTHANAPPGASTGTATTPPRL